MQQENLDPTPENCEHEFKAFQDPDSSHQDSRMLLKRFAPGHAGYLQRHYHSLPHHYKLPTSLNGQATLPSQGIAEKNTCDVPYNEYSQKLSLIIDWYYLNYTIIQRHLITYF